MTETVVNAVVAVVGAIVGALASALIAHFVSRRRASDHDAFALWRIAFDRPAFKGPYTWHSDQQAFKRAIEATIKAVNTGVLLDSSGADLGRGIGKSKSQLRKAELRTKMDEVEARLTRIQKMIPSEPAAQISDPAIMDQERDEIIKILNSIWQAMRIPTLTIPTEVPTYGDVIGS